MPSPSRRSFLTYLGLGSYATLVDTRPSRGGPAPDGPVRRPRGTPPGFFTPIESSSLDELKVPNGFRVDFIAKWDEDLGSKGPQGAEKFGYNNDFLAYFPINALTGGAPNCDEGLLWVNHEYALPLFVSGYDPRAGKKTEQQIIKEKLAVGGSILHLRRVNGRWERVPASEFTQRCTALYPDIALAGPASMLPAAAGTLANCSGGRTPWYTALTCEENYHYCNAASTNDSTAGWWRSIRSSNCRR
jgi:secreted PhoX family phosphatase